MDIAWADIALSAFRVLLVGLLLGAGLPALFAVGMKLQSVGAGESTGAAPAQRRPFLTGLGWLIFAAVIAVVLLGVLYITRHSLHHYLGLSLFGA